MRRNRLQRVEVKIHIERDWGERDILVGGTYQPAEPDVGIDYPHFDLDDLDVELTPSEEEAAQLALWEKWRLMNDPMEA